MSNVHSNDKVKNRIKFIFLLFCLIFAVILGRLFIIQILQSEFYHSLAVEQRMQRKPVDSDRGKIMDRQGNELAINIEAETIIAYPEEIENPAYTAQKLAGILSLNKDVLKDRLDRDSYLVYLERQVSSETYQQISELDLEGISAINEPKRYYPRENLASQILGFTGVDNHGLEGLEFFHNRILSGQPGFKIGEIDARGQNIPLTQKRDNEVIPEQGNNIYLTIDEVIQYYASKELSKAQEKHDISGGSVIVMDPDNGEILALANEPNFNPNNFASYNSDLWRNKAVHDNFEPGSVFKIFTAALFLEYGYYNYNDTLYDPGHINVNGEKINCWKDGGHGELNFVEVFAQSCNPGFVEMGLTMESEEFISGLEQFNFGRKTGIDLPAESTGSLIPDHYGQVEQATMSFGHGISTTPLQLLTAGLAIANGGYIYQPKLIDKITDSNDSTIEKISSQKIRQAISSKTSKKVRKMMREAVANGTGEEAQIEGYNIAGKTGTSRLYGEEEIYNTSFLGLVPGDDPEIAVVVVLYELKGEDYFASENAVPVFKNLVRNIIRYKDIPPTEGEIDLIQKSEQELQNIKINDYTGNEAEKTARLLRNKGLNVKLLGEGERILEQRPLSETKISEDSTVYLILEEDYKDKSTIVPDFRGLTPREAEELAWRHGLKIDGIVSGEVTYQHPVPGDMVEYFSRIELE